MLIGNVILWPTDVHFRLLAVVSARQPYFLKGGAAPGTSRSHNRIRGGVGLLHREWPEDGTGGSSGSSPRNVDPITRVRVGKARKLCTSWRLRRGRGERGTLEGCRQLMMRRGSCSRSRPCQLCLFAELQRMGAHLCEWLGRDDLHPRCRRPATLAPAAIAAVAGPHRSHSPLQVCQCHRVGFPEHWDLVRAWRTRGFFSLVFSAFVRETPAFDVSESDR